MSVPKPSTEMTAVFVPTAVARRPTFEQVLRPWTEGSQHLLLPRREDRIVDIPSFLMDDFLVSTRDEDESDKARKLLYQGEFNSLE